MFMCVCVYIQCSPVNTIRYTNTHSTLNVRRKTINRIIFYAFKCRGFDVSNWTRALEINSKPNMCVIADRRL